MHRQPVKSSDIKSMGYDPLRGILELEFITGKVFRYGQVTLEVFEELNRAESKGKYFWGNIRGTYPFEEGEGG
jgi:hypothetical protein